MTGQITQPGDLDRRLLLQAPVEIEDGEGGTTRVFTDVCTLWAQVTPLTARADIAAGSLGAALRYRIAIRRRDDITTRHIFQDSEKVYRVIAVSESDDRRFNEITAERRED